MFRRLALCLALLVGLALIGCGGSSEPPPTPDLAGPDKGKEKDKPPPRRIPPVPRG